MEQSAPEGQHPINACRLTHSDPVTRANPRGTQATCDPRRRVHELSIGQRAPNWSSWRVVCALFDYRFTVGCGGCTARQVDHEVRWQLTIDPDSVSLDVSSGAGDGFAVIRGTSTMGTERLILLGEELPQLLIDGFGVSQAEEVGSTGNDDRVGRPRQGSCELFGVRYGVGTVG